MSGETVADYPELVTQWHPTKNGRLAPDDVTAGTHKKVWWKCRIGPDHEWQANVCDRTRGKGCPFCAGQRVSVTNNLASNYPQIAEEWHPTRNNGLNPDEIVYGTTKRVWWKCAKGPDHEWEAQVYKRTKSGRGCPFCAGRKVSVTNRLDLQFPQIAEQWHPEKNGDLRPNDVAEGTNRKVWWKCPEGPDHEWENRVVARTASGRGCPFCSNYRVSVTNRLSLHYPETAKQWHSDKNGNLSPHEIPASSQKKVWWKCPNGPDHIWQTTVRHRTLDAHGCPFCAGQRASVTNSLQALYAEVARLWHPEKNGDLLPSDVPGGSNKKVWWQCPEGPDHEWQAQVKGRTIDGQGCPFCSNQRVSVTNSLASLHSKIAKEWHGEKNGNLTPDDVAAGSHKKVWWRCSVNPNHAWETRVHHRTIRKTGCPLCLNQQVSDTNRLSTTHPEIAQEWHPTRNGTSTPEQTINGSGKRFWWKCPKGPDHEWKTAVYKRTVEGQGCPFCSGKRVSLTNTLSHLFPEIAADWHPTKNGNLTPSEVVAGSGKKFWWRCSKDPAHEWEATGDSRTGKRKQGCPVCNRGWTTLAVQHFVRSLMNHIDALSPAELFTIFQQSGMATTAGRAKGFIKALATGRFPKEELEKFAEGEASLVDRFIDDHDLKLEEVDEEPAPDEEEITAILDESEVDGDDDVGLPTVSSKQSLELLDSDLIVADSDEEALEFFVASGLAKIWRHVYADESSALAEVESHEPSTEYSKQVQEGFLESYWSAKRLEIPKGYSFEINGEIALPLLMQRHVATCVRIQRRFGNWSGTGAGKTLSAILASRVVNANTTLICCPNAVVAGWAGEIRRTYPDSCVQQKTWEPSWSTGDHRYLIQNYAQFQQRDSESRMKRFLDRETVDFVVIDEIHYSKQRHVDQMSRRKQLVMGLVSHLSEVNPDVCVLGMSATPVINNLQEGKSLVELITTVEHDDIPTRATIPNCNKLHQKLVTLGTRWMPNYDIELDERHEEVDCSEYLNEIQALDERSSPLEVEKVLTRARLPIILKHLKPGQKTLIYTHYVEGISKMLFDAITEAGFKVGFYTGQDKTGLEGFKYGDVDVLIGSSSVGTGLDGLQHVCDQLIINVLPWTNAEYEQLKGRIWRQGQRSKKVSVIIPVTFAEVNGERWSWCESKLKRIKYKKSIADAAVDGVIPEGNLRTPAQAKRDILSWLERLENGDVSEIVRRKIVVPLSDEDPKDVKRRVRRYGDFSKMNNRWNTTGSEKTHLRLTNNPEEWEQYHTLYAKARKDWTVVPVMEVANWLKDREGYEVGDFGCGTAILDDEVSDRHQVHSFDHIAIDDRVLACDMSRVPLDDECLDVAVFSLSLMGANFADYLREALRTLRLDGLLHIWEATSRFDDPKRFAKQVEELGFRCLFFENRAQFTSFQFMKTRRGCDQAVTIQFK